MQQQVEKSQADSMKELVQLSAERTFMNAERTLSVWVRTSLGAMIFGIAIDRFGFMLQEMSAITSHHLQYHIRIMHITGVLLVIYSMLVALLYSLRFIKYSSSYSRSYQLPAGHNFWLSPFFAFLVILFGIPLLVVMLWV